MELTVVSKLDLSAQDKQRLERTLDVFAAACNTISQIVFVRPNYTSRTCPRCGHVSSSNRLSTRLFRCQNCGFQHNANLVASVNTATRAVQAGLVGAGLLSTSLRLRELNPLSANGRL